MKRPCLVSSFLLLTMQAAVAADSTSAIQRTFSAANGLSITVKQVAPGNQPSDVQIICYLKHKPQGDNVIEALIDFDRNAGGLIAALRNDGAFVGDERETLYFVPPPGKLKARSILLVGLGAEDALSLETMKRIGVVGIREAIRLKSNVVSYASAIKDQGVDRLEAGEVAAQVVSGIISAYDTEKRLQSTGRAPLFTVKEWIYEAGPAYYKSTVEHVQQAVAATNAEVNKRGPLR